MNNSKNTFRAPSVLGIRTSNWDNIGGASNKKGKRTMFTSKLRKYSKNIPAVNVIRQEIEKKKAERKLIGDLRIINQSVGGGACGNVIFCKNGAIQIKGKGFIKNPLVKVA